MRLFDYFEGNFALRNVEQLKCLENDDLGLKRFQRGMLKGLLSHAYNTVPYYHTVLDKIDLNPNYDDPYIVLSKLPILTKDVIREQHSNLISRSSLRYKVIQTSGSSGNPLRFLKDNRAEGFGKASYYEGLSWYGYNLGDPIVQLWGRRPVFTNKRFLINFKNMVTNFFELNAHAMSDLMIENYIKKIIKIKPRVLYGYVSSLYLFSKYLSENKLSLNIPVVVTTAEKLFDFQRSLLSATTGRQVYNQYGCSEVTSVAFECPHHGCFHVMPKVILDLVGKDGEVIDSNESGRIILTDLTNYKMPFLKYEVGDLATKSELGSCLCGRKLQSIVNIEGRTSDIILGLNGNRVHGEFFSHLFESSGFAPAFGLKQFQVVQKTRSLLIIKLNVDLIPKKEYLLYLDRLIREYLGNIDIEYEFLSDIPLHSTGKRRFTISEISA